MAANGGVTESGGQFGAGRGGDHTRRRVSRAAPSLPGGPIHGLLRVGIWCRCCTKVQARFPARAPETTRDGACGPLWVMRFAPQKSPSVWRRRLWTAGILLSLPLGKWRSPGRTVATGLVRRHRTRKAADKNRSSPKPPVAARPGGQVGGMCRIRLPRRQMLTARRDGLKYVTFVPAP